MSVRLGETILAGNTDTTGFLPKSGGVMTGNITVKGIDDFSIHAPNNNTYVGIHGGDGTNAYNGCELFLTGKDHTDWHGGFGIRTGNGNSDECKTFSGHPNGELKWDNKRIETTTVKNDTLTVSGLNGFTAEISAQARIEHELYYEYFVIITITGGTLSLSDQTQVCQIYGLQGTQFYTHQAIPVWCEGGCDYEQGLFYGSSIYLGKCSGSDKDRRITVHTLRFKE